MPSSQHETLVAMFRRRPQLAAELLAALGVAVPDHEQARAESSDLPDLTPTEYRADHVVELTSGGSSVSGIVVEVQLRRAEQKRWTWPVYVATLRARLRCPVMLLVICVNRRTAQWSAEPIELGPGSHLTPLVVGPERLPRVGLREAARAPEFAVLSALAHADDPDPWPVLDSLVIALASADREYALLYSDLVLGALPAALRRELEERMTAAEKAADRWSSDFARTWYGRGWAEGEAEGRGEALLEVLAAREVVVDDAARERITACRDVTQIDAWLRRAAVATTVDEVFADG